MDPSVTLPAQGDLSRPGVAFRASAPRSSGSGEDNKPGAVTKRDIERALVDPDARGIKSPQDIEKAEKRDKEKHPKLR